MEILLFGVIVVLAALLGWQEYNGRKERAKMLNAIIAKTTEENINLTLADNTKTEVESPPLQPDLTPLDNLSNEELMDQLNKEMGNNG